MLKKALVVGGFTTVSVCGTGSLRDQFESHKQKYNLTFGDEVEEEHRFTVFKKNLVEAAKLTVKSGGNAVFGASKFAHLTKNEFRTRLGYKASSRFTHQKKLADHKKSKKFTTTATVEDTDWRGTGMVSPVKDQGQCGSCWAFSATEAVETGYFKATGSQVILAPQQVTSCDPMDYGCNGGDPPTAYEYFENAGGVELERDYPYKSGETERTGECKADSSKFKVKVTDYTTIATEGVSDETTAMVETIKESPMSICVDASSWQFYLGGVVDSSTCGEELDHCVHLVGLKTDKESPYWVVKNSWASDWGEEGYIYVKYGENACGVGMEATTATASDEDYSYLGGKKSAVFV